MARSINIHEDIRVTPASITHTHIRGVGVAVFGCMLFAAALSFFIFNNQSLRLDEAQSLWQASHSVRTIISLVSADVHVPLYHVLLHGWELIWGNSVSTARMLSLAFFLLSIPALYRLGSYVYNERVGLYATLLLTLSPFVNWYGNEIRMYSLFTLLTILHQYFFVRIVRNHLQEKQTGVWIGYVTTAILGMYTHYFFNFIFITQIVFVLFHLKLFPRATIYRFVRAGCIAILAFLPWVALVVQSGTMNAQAPQLMPPSSVNVFNTFSQFLFGFQDDHINTILVSLWPLSLLLVFWTLQKHKTVSTETIYFIMAILIPIAGAFVVSVLVRPLFLSRYLILTLPAVYLVLSWIFSVYPRRLRYVAQTILALLMIVTLGIESISAETPIKEDYRAASGYLTTYAGPGDIILITAPFTIYPIEYYYRGSASLDTMPHWDRFKTGPIPSYSDDALGKEVERLKSNYQRLWILFSYDQGYEDKAKLYLDTHLEKKDQKIFSPSLELRAYQLQY